MRIIVFTDVHGNLPALNAVLGEVNKRGYDTIIHLGDVINTGPYPAECLDLLLETPRIQFVMGNCDARFVDDPPKPRNARINDGESLHMQWTREQLRPQLKDILAQWPYFLENEFEGVKATFVHYGLTKDESGRTGWGHLPAGGLDEMFTMYDTPLVFYGHTHQFLDIQGHKRYINPGSLGCSETAAARYCVAEFHKGNYTIEHHTVGYDDKELYESFEKRRVPNRHFIYKKNFGGRFPIRSEK